MAPTPDYVEDERKLKKFLEEHLDSDGSLKYAEQLQEIANRVRRVFELFLDDFEILKLEVRLCVDLKILPMKKQAEIAGLMDGIGKQITGWRNAGMVRGA